MGFAFFLPFPDVIEEFFPLKILAALLRLGEELALDDGLGRDPGVVGPRHPERLESLHPLQADEDVLQSVYEGMAHVQNAGDIRRRDDDAERRFAGRCVGFEKFALLPEGVPLFFDGFRIVGFG